MMRETGMIVDVTPTLTDDGSLVDIELNAQLVGEPECKGDEDKFVFIFVTPRLLDP